MNSFSLTKRKIVFIVIATLGISTSYTICNASHITPIAYATHINRHINRPNKVIKSNKGAKGTLQLSQPLGVEDSRHGDQKVITIPKGQVLHYQKQNDGYVVWNKKYPNNSDHQYDANSSLSKQLIAHDAKDHNVPQNKNKGVQNINNANKKRARQQAKNKAKVHKIKPSLPKTSDNVINFKVVIAAIVGAVLTAFLLVNKSVKHLLSYKK